MPVLVVALAVVVLLVLMTKFRINGFIALFAVALMVGLLQGMPLLEVYESATAGIGDQLSDLVLILGFGAMLGKILADSGAAQRIATRLVDVFGISKVQLAMMLTAVCLGITLFYEVAFVLLIPLVFTLVREYKLPLLWVGLPMSITLSTMHSFLPPHPGPAAVTETFEASQGLTLLYGLPIAIVAASALAFTWPRLVFVRSITPSIPKGLITEHKIAEEDMPGFGTCVGIVLVPVLMMAASAVAELSMDKDAPALRYFEFFGEAPVALLVALVLAVLLVGGNIDKVARSRVTVAADRGRTATGKFKLSRQGQLGTGAGDGASSVALDESADVSVPPARSRFQAAMDSAGEAVKPMAMIMLVIGAGGAFKQVLIDSGIADYITQLTNGWDISPIILAWVIAAMIRIAIGSASVAVVTAAGIVLPLVGPSGVPPELMVLAVTCGSIAFSHVTDPGFWLFKEYLNLSVVEAIKVRTTYSTVLALIGLGGVLLMNALVG
ncbi:GntT/GntP/DsdX family permease [Marmoricola endophyticus]|nr:SLC13 family permease [Marmoricola endophyticus]